MPCLTVRWAAMDTGAENLKSIWEHMDQIAASVDSIRSSLSFSDRSSYEIKRRLQNISADVSRQSQRLRLMSSTLLQARRRYSACEIKLAEAMVRRGLNRRGDRKV